MQAPTGAEFGLLGLVLMALVAALVWHMRTTTSQLMQVVRENTAALIELRVALRDRVLCPYQASGPSRLESRAEAGAGP